MLKLRASQEGLEVRMTDDEIMDKVLVTSRGFKPGRGRKLPNTALSSSVRSYLAPSPPASQAALTKFMEKFFMDDASDEDDEGDALEDDADAEEE
ncbi:hypothetical protein Tco_1341132 [Tanacetum coccineum]